MKLFVAYTAVVLGIMFHAGALIAGVEVLHEENLLSSPKLKPALGFFVSGFMFSAPVCVVGARDGDKSPRVLRRPPGSG